MNDIEQLKQACRAAFADLERQIEQLRHELRNARADIGDLTDRLDALEQTEAVDFAQFE